MSGICVVCQVDDATGRMKTCTNCRASMHRWDQRSVGEILERATKLRTYRRRMEQFAMVDEENEKVARVDRQVLVDKRIMMYRGLKRRTASNIVHLRLKDKRRARAVKQRTHA